MSLSAELRAERLMTCAERDRLLTQGFSAAVIDALAERGYRPCQPPGNPPKQENRCGFLRQTTLPHLHLSLCPGDGLEELDTALYEAGRRDGHDTLASYFMRFFECVKARPAAPDLSTLEQRLAALEARLSTETPPS
jgi:hypothetical protein